MAEQLPPADPADQAAVEYAAELMRRSSLVRIDPGTIVTIKPSGRFRRQGMAYSVSRLSAADRDWLAEYQAAAKAQRRADREAARRQRRGQE